MKISLPLVLRVSATAGLLAIVPASLAQTLKVTPVNSSGVYSANQPISWDVKVTGSHSELVTAARYELKQNGGTVLASGTLDLSISGSARLTAPGLSEPATLLATLKAKGFNGLEIQGLGGAAVEPEKIQPVQPAPSDFDDFWKGKLEALRKVPAAPKVDAGDSDRADVEYFKVELGSIGSTVRAQLARPKKQGKFPAIIILQWAGVYPLQKGTVIGKAAQGWLAFNVMPHDLPIDADPAFYKQQQEGPLKEYGAQGNHDRESSYMLGMFLRAVRAAEYLTGRPDWDGKVLVATGASMGGYQALVLAALEPRVTSVVVDVPAGCQHAGKIAGRAGSWPYWAQRNVTPQNEAAILEASRYFDAVNFAPRIKVPVLVSAGLIDTTCPPSGILAMANQLAGKKEVLIMPLAPHQNVENSHAPFTSRSAEWLKLPGGN